MHVRACNSVHGTLYHTRCYCATCGLFCASIILLGVLVFYRVPLTRANRLTIVHRLVILLAYIHA
jgi:hypothetical protein